jgi:hypothetical protein
MGRASYLLGCVVFFVFSIFASAQTGAGSIQGTVTDSTGAVVSDAQITAVNSATNASRSATSSDGGTYAIPNLAVGAYTVAIEKTGFATAKMNVTVTVGDVTPVNAILDVGSVKDTVTVDAQQIAPVETESSQISNLVDSRRIKDLPLLTRNPYQLALLSPGTATTTSGNGGFSVNGARDRNNNFLLDGVDNNDTSVPGILGGVLSANPESTEEFRIITNAFAAEYGRNTGAIVDVVTKSGSNAFHADAYWFGRWNSFGGARDWFNHNIDPRTDSVEAQNPYVRNQFGYSIGGPIIKNKTFFFFNHEIQRFRTTLTNQSTVPTQAFKDGVFTWHTTQKLDDGSRVPVDVPIDLGPDSPQNLLRESDTSPGAPADPTIQKLFSIYPDPTLENGDGYTGSLFFPSSSKQDSYQAVVKVDHHITDRETVSARYGYNYFKDPNGFHTDFLPGNVGAIASKGISQGLSVSLNSTLSNSLLNNFTVGWNRIYAPFNLEGLDVLNNPDFNVVDEFGRGRDYIFNSFSGFGSALFADSQSRTTGTLSFTETLSWVKGSHNLKFGSDFRNVSERGPNSFFSRRQVDLRANTVGFTGLLGVDNRLDGFRTLEDDASAYWGFVANDFYGEYFDKNQNRLADDNKRFRQHEYDFFAQDSWKIRRNLTLNLGLRYQFNGVPFEEGGNLSNVFGDPTIAPLTFTNVGPGTGHLLYDNDLSNIEPRIGFSWDPWGDGKTAIRGAYGIFHDRVFGNLFGNARGNPPFEQDYQTFPGETINDFFATGGFPNLAPPTNPTPVVGNDAFLVPVLFDQHFQNASSQNWNFGVQRELPGSWVLDVAYVASKATHIARVVEANPPDPALVNLLVADCNADPENCDPSTISGGALWFIGGVANTALGRGSALNRSVGNSNYHSLQTKITHRFAHGFQIQGSYTWSHAIDDSNDPITPGNLGGNPSFPRDSRNLRSDRGNSDADVRHVATVNYIWELPFGRGKHMASEGLVGRVLEGFQISGLASLQTGHPFTVLSGVDTFRTGRIGYANLVGDPYSRSDIPNEIPGLKTIITNPSAFEVPEFGSIGTAGKNAFYGPSFVSFDVSVAKKMHLTERIGWEFRVEGYNIFNHPNFLNPGTDTSLIGNIVTSGLFGIVTGTVGNSDGTTGARQLQVGMKLTF